VSLRSWLLLVVALLPIGVALLWALLGRREPFDPGPDGFWRAPLRHTQYGLRVEPELVHLHARTPRWAAAIGVVLLLCGWGLAGRAALRPFASDLPLPAPVRQALARGKTRVGDIIKGVGALAFGLLFLASSRRHTDVILESQGDLRWHQSPRLVSTR
jgi:hypothetical protein